MCQVGGGCFASQPLYYFNQCKLNKLNPVFGEVSTYVLPIECHKNGCRCCRNVRNDTVKSVLVVIKPQHLILYFHSAEPGSVTSPDLVFFCLWTGHFR